MTVHPGELLLRVTIVYCFLFILLPTLGKRHVGQLAPFDLLILLILSECVQNAMVAGDNSLIATSIARVRYAMLETDGDISVGLRAALAKD